MNDNRCIFCGEIIPEGRQVCPECERKALNGKLNRAEIRRIQKQQSKQSARFYVTQAEVERMVKEALFRSQKHMIEEYNEEFIARDSEIKNQLINFLHRLWLSALGEYGITDRELTHNLDQYVKQKFRLFSEYIDMGESDHAREMLADIGVPASIVGLAEKHWRASPDDDITIEIEDE